MGSCDLTVPRYIMNNISLVLWLLLVSARGQEQAKQCKEQEFAQTRNNYELCASRKIGEITSWLQKEEQQQEKEEKEEGLMAVCRAVRQLIHDCGNALSYCFTTDQVVMNIILFCRVLSVDFSPGLITACKTDSREGSQPQPGSRSGTNQHLTRYVRSLFQEDGTSTKKTTKD